MWAFEHIVCTSDVQVEQIWAVYQDVNCWSVWDTELESTELKGDFSVGSVVLIKPKRGPRVKGVITECVPNKLFTDVTTLPLKTTVAFSHHINMQDGQLMLKHRVVIAGPLTFIFKRLIGFPVSRHLPATMNRLLEFAKQYSSNTLESSDD